MGLNDIKFPKFDLSTKRGHSSSLSESKSSTISDVRAPRETPKWMRITGVDIHLASINEQAAELLKTNKHMRIQLNEAQRLRALKERSLDPSEREWIDGTLQDIEDTSREVAIFLEPTRVETETGGGRISLGRRIKWVYRDNQRARDKTNRLLACNTSLIAVLTHLQRVEVGERPISYELPANIPAKFAINSSASLHESNSGMSSSEINNLERVSKWSPSTRSLNHEMQDMLAWQLSKGAHLQ
ncbi:hypothetical protein N7495_005180 [Penicillium taxi]|uniref:uncharacterized protein n=1 Tax=Penicillium taxi TaxID=168475 RepID=UPI00254546C7|nr:uncharacterized protein N7495_005180 [Penicillium taxi]KAJ5893489.1 hypothetical protein N7495_005180 [Penicillium taxi]